MRVTDRLVADIGGTNARFAMLDENDRPVEPMTLPCDQHTNLSAALDQFLASQQITSLKHAAIAVATPITGDQVTLTNRQDWSFSQRALKQQFSLETLLVLNDYSALAYSIPYLDVSDLQVVGPNIPPSDGAIALLGPGTGLGVSGLVPSRDVNNQVLSYGALQGEGGHVTLSIATDREQAVYSVLENKYGHVSAERVLSGPGIEELHSVLRYLDGAPAESLEAPEISKRALAGSDVHCLEALQIFCALLGSCAGNLALTLGATGGVYIGGGITPRLGDFFLQSAFRERFEAKGRMGQLLQTMPTFVITAPYPALIGCAKTLTNA